MENDKVTLIKSDGKKYEDISANVQPTMIFISDYKLPIEEGDFFERKLPNDLIEKYVVIDRGFHNRGPFGPHYQCKVRKETTINTINNLNSKTIYNINGPNAKVNINSNDNSINTVNITENQLFEEIIKTIKNQISNNDELIKTVYDMKLNIGKKGFFESYQNFINLAANHLTILAPFLPALTQFIIQ